ncbi:hypothetical protein K458DRAFT_414976 [Lentithecium fluviatile CBS 122367]|uniref:Uncharacterized protein n=1 Tax=Lentithecium fluviatile CBS 122367 TaxID=1168545 RepID=A0A6G1JBG6_9PLEO|nr:hypothetical protein K458DRAFT_414976 [Lentithecium fluviatile CBS 122367]
MFCKVTVLVALAACAESVVSAGVEFHLYAYGNGIKSGLQLFYGDGQAYVGASAPTFVTEAVNITLSQAEEGTEFVATPDTTVDWDSEPTMYIDTTEGAINAVGFVKGNETLGDGETTTGLGLYGGWAFHKVENSTIEMKFIATPTNESDIYLIKWNAGGTKASDEVAVSLRTQAPVSLDS